MKLTKPVTLAAIATTLVALAESTCLTRPNVLVPGGTPAKAQTGENLFNGTVFAQCWTDTGSTKYNVTLSSYFYDADTGALHYVDPPHTVTNTSAASTVIYASKCVANVASIHADIQVYTLSGVLVSANHASYSR